MSMNWKYTMNAELKELDEDTYEVIDIIPRQYEFVKPGDVYITLNNDVAIDVRNEITLGNQVLIKKGKVNDAKTTGRDIQMFEFGIVKRSDLEKEKHAAYAKIEDAFTSYVMSVSILDMFGFFTTYAELASKGYYITDDNKDEIIQDMLNASDNSEGIELVKLVEDYIENKAKLEQAYESRKKLLNTRQIIEAASKPEEIKKAVKNFIGE